MAPRKIRVNGIELHYIERGTGEALVLVHGGLGDYRSWEPQLSAFSQRFRVFSYSRRYSYPNENTLIVPGHSVFAEAEDLAALLSGLQLGRVHLVGHSYGAFVALTLALKYPNVARTLVLAEPPVHGWARDVPGGEALLEQLLTNVWAPVKGAFEREDVHLAIRAFTDGIGGPGYFDNLPDDARATRLQNVRAVRALMQSSDAFPALSRDKTRSLTVPTLVIEGAGTLRIHQLVDDELLRCIPNSERVIIPNAGHGTPRDNPGRFNKAVLQHLSRHG